jgi:O-6-methylguanine DNA methyltransferase
MEVYASIDTKFGKLYIVDKNDYIEYVGTEKPEGCEEGMTENLDAATHRIASYLEGNRKKSFRIPLHLTGTAFQQKVYSALLDVKYGETITYSELAAKAGSPSAARAVGTALNKNPLLILVPCHRVIGNDGSIGDFVLGAEVKQALLDMEKNNS